MFKHKLHTVEYQDQQLTLSKRDLEKLLKNATILQEEFPCKCKNLGIAKNSAYYLIPGVSKKDFLQNIERYKVTNIRTFISKAKNEIGIYIKLANSTNILLYKEEFKTAQFYCNSCMGLIKLEE